MKPKVTTDPPLSEWVSDTTIPIATISRYCPSRWMNVVGVTCSSYRESIATWRRCGLLKLEVTPLRIVVFISIVYTLQTTTSTTMHWFIQPSIRVQTAMWIFDGVFDWERQKRNLTRSDRIPEINPETRVSSYTAKIGTATAAAAQKLNKKWTRGEEWAGGWGEIRNK